MAHGPLRPLDGVARPQNWFVKALVLLFVCAIVVATLWLLNALPLVGGWVGIHWPWLRIPRVRPLIECCTVCTVTATSG